MNSDYTINECENERNAHCKDTFFDLEAKGMYTTEILKKEKDAMERYSSMELDIDDQGDEVEEQGKDECNQQSKESKDGQLPSVAVESGAEKTVTFPNQPVSALLEIDTSSEMLDEDSDYQSLLPESLEEKDANA